MVVMILMMKWTTRIHCSRRRIGIRLIVDSVFGVVVVVAREGIIFPQREVEDHHHHHHPHHHPLRKDQQQQHRMTFLNRRIGVHLILRSRLFERKKDRCHSQETSRGDEDVFISSTFCMNLMWRTVVNQFITKTWKENLYIEYQYSTEME